MKKVLREPLVAFPGCWHQMEALVTEVETLENISLACFRVWNSFLSDSFPLQNAIDEGNEALWALIEKDEETLARLMALHMQRTQQALANLVF